MADLVRVDGLRELQSKLLALGVELGTKSAFNPVRNAVSKAARVVQKLAKEKVRKRTGTLEQNIIVTSRGKPDDRGFISAKVVIRSKAKAYKDNRQNRRNNRVGDNFAATYKNYGPLYYARFLEFGTSKMPAYPFLRPAFEETKNQLPELIKTELAAAIERSVAKLGR